MRKLKYNEKGYIVDTIYGKDTVRRCDSNIAKMSVWEWCYYKITHWGYFSEICSILGEEIGEVVKNLIYLTINLIALILLPITLPLTARRSIKEAKESIRDNCRIKGNGIRWRYEALQRAEKAFKGDGVNE